MLFFDFFGGKLTKLLLFVCEIVVTLKKTKMLWISFFKIDNKQSRNQLKNWCNNSFDKNNPKNWNTDSTNSY